MLTTGFELLGKIQTASRFRGLKRRESSTTNEKFYVAIEAEEIARHLRNVTLEVALRELGLASRANAPEKAMGAEGLEPPTNEL